MKQLKYAVTAALVALFLALPAQAQTHRFSFGAGQAIMGEDDYIVPTVSATYAWSVANALSLEGRSHVTWMRNKDAFFVLDQDDFTSVSVTAGIAIHPIRTQRHRLDLRIGAALRGRWEDDTIYGVMQRRTDGTFETVESRRIQMNSADAGLDFGAGYSIRVFRGAWIELESFGLDYLEGTSLYNVGGKVGYTF
jgi:hypothetical protein